MKMLGAISLVLFVAGCLTLTTALTNHNIPLPTVVRADTRDFVGFRFLDSSDVALTLKIITEALPNEAGVCLYGFARDTVIHILDPRLGYNVPIDKKIAMIDSVAIADIDSAGPQFVTYTDGVACKPNRQLIGKLHTHPMSQHLILGGHCDHSDPDALYMHHNEQTYWFSLVMCPYSTNILWADGRRLEFRFQNPFRGGG